MSLVVSVAAIQQTKSERFKYLREGARQRYQAEFGVAIPSELLDDASLAELLKATVAGKDAKAQRAIEAIQATFKGKADVVIPNHRAFHSMLVAHLSANVLDGWLYRQAEDGTVSPVLITSIQSEPKAHNRDEPRVGIFFSYYGPDNDRENTQLTIRHSCVWFYAGDVARRRVEAALNAKGLFHETPKLRARYDDQLKHYETVRPMFGKQLVFTGRPFAAHRYSTLFRPSNQYDQLAVIHDLSASDFGEEFTPVESQLLDGDRLGIIPVLPVIRLFDLTSHEFFWANTEFLKPHVFNTKMRNQLVLPQSHRDLIDILITDLDAFTGDFVEGHAAGNIILCKGVPGCGKTSLALTHTSAMQKPLYIVKSGLLGTNAGDIERNITEVFARARRWDCPVLLDECDVVMADRGDNIERNAVVAVFLRLLESYTGLLWCTSNRPDDIDDAVISRCAAVIHFDVPKGDDLRRVWTVLAEVNDLKLEPQLLNELVELFPTIAPRDIKHLLRLALRYRATRGDEINAQLFRKIAMFRAVEIAPLATAA